MHKLAKSILLFALVLFTQRSAVSAPLYRITDLTPSGYSSSAAYDVNSSGDAVGVASGPSGDAFFYYDHVTGVSTPFGVGVVSPRSSIEGNGGYRRAAINDSGLVAGTARFLSGDPQARGFIYNPIGGAFTNLGFIPGASATGIRPSSDALDINSSGVATGTATSGAGTIPTEGDNSDVYVGSGPPVTDIDGDTTVNTRGDVGRAINDAGHVVGRSKTGVAALFFGAAETYFLTGTTMAGDSSEAFDINNSDQIVGQNYTTSESFRYDTSESSLLTIPQIGTGLRMFAKAINEEGDVVGAGDRGTGVSDQNRGFVYDDGDATSYILEDHVFNLDETEGSIGIWETINTAWGINDSGWIVGQGARRLGGGGFPSARAFLLRPIELSGLAGDYNNDGTVDLADYTVWRSNLGASVDFFSGADANGNGMVDPDDYEIWRSNFGLNMAPLDLSGSSVPEPSSIALWATMSALVVMRSGRKRFQLNA